MIANRITLSWRGRRSGWGTMKREELLQLAQRYRLQGNNLAMAGLIYKEVARRFPATEEATFARIQLAAIQGANCSNALVILPLPLDEGRMRQGGAEHIDLGSRRYRIYLPRGLDIGHRVRLRNDHLDTLLNGDVHLLVQRRLLPLVPVTPRSGSRRRTNLLTAACKLSFCSHEQSVAA